MIPIAEYKITQDKINLDKIDPDNHDYLIAWDKSTDQFFLLFNTLYQNNKETVAIQLPTNIWDAYYKHGHGEFSSWVKRIDEDYQVGRFSKDNPRLHTDYQLATAEEKSSILHCFETQIPIIEQEALRLLFSLRTTYSHLAAGIIYDNLAKGKNIPIEIFLLLFKFYEREKPLVDNSGKLLIAKANAEEALTILEQNPVSGCPDAAHIVLGLLTRCSQPLVAFHHLSRLESLKAEFNFRYLREELDYFTNQYQSLQDKDEPLSVENIIHEFRQAFPSRNSFQNIIDITQVPDWIFWEETLAWDWDCKKCLEECFTANDIVVTYNDIQEFLHLPSGTDSQWHRYSFGQSMKYFCNEDPANFTKETVKKPKFPVTGHEDFIIGVWQHYFKFFNPETLVSREQLNAVLQQFVVEWNNSEN